MCLIALQWNPQAEWPLVVVANRDEQHARPTRELGIWPDAPAILAGRDLQAGGTWMGVNRYGGFAALTNYREPAADKGLRSRGELVANYLKKPPPDDLNAYAAQLPLAAYAGFNLLLGDRKRLIYLSNRDPSTPKPVAPGTHGLSNALLDTPWPKLQGVRDGLACVQEAAEQPPDELLALMQRREPYPDATLPDTGVGLVFERFLSPPFICTPAYGTRNSTWLRLGQSRVDMFERRFDPAGQIAGESRESLSLERPD
ncbi:MAG: NRDE family protein [Oceanococcus sp.]|nr:MAG: NRDE family protein [Oceanococcus sp.]